MSFQKYICILYFKNTYYSNYAKLFKWKYKILITLNEIATTKTNLNYYF